jgi:hypothetical protein
MQSYLGTEAESKEHGVWATSVADPYPGSGAFLTPGSGIRDPGSGMGKNQDPGSGINIPDPQHCGQHEHGQPYASRP